MSQKRLIFGSYAQLYDRVRPSYPAALVDDLVALAGEPSRAVDVGCGTGKATTLLATRGLAGVGIEPDVRMAELARVNLASFVGWRVDVTDFESWEPRSGDLPVDLVTAAQAWHWVDSKKGPKQAGRMLRTGGLLAIFGHDSDPKDSPVLSAMNGVNARYGVAPSVRALAPREPVAPGLGFGESITRSYPVAQDYTATDWIERLQTSSEVRSLPAACRALFLEEIAAAIESHGGTYHHHYTCRLWAAPWLGGSD